MNSKFDPNNAVIKLCMSGMGLEGSGNIEDAVKEFQKAWHEATNDYERFIFFRQKTPTSRTGRVQPNK